MNTNKAGFKGFQKGLHSHAFVESTLSIERLKKLNKIPIHISFNLCLTLQVLFKKHHMITQHLEGDLQVWKCYCFFYMSPLSFWGFPYILMTISHHFYLFIYFIHLSIKFYLFINSFIYSFICSRQRALAARVYYVKLLSTWNKDYLSIYIFIHYFF